MGWTCGTCGRQHEDMLLDIAYLRPVHYFLVPESDRGLRVRESDDVCVLDDEVFLIRGVLYVPVPEINARFGWGFWASIGEADFENYMAMWDRDGSSSPPFTGRLDSEPRAYPGLLGHEVTVQLRGASERPVFTLAPADSLLSSEQSSGYSVERVWELLHQCAPHLVA